MSNNWRTPGDGCAYLMRESGAGPMFRIKDLGRGKIEISSCPLSVGENNMTIEVDSEGKLIVTRQNVPRIMKETAAKLDMKIIYKLCIGEIPMCNKRAVTAQADEYIKYRNEQLSPPPGFINIGPPFQMNFPYTRNDFAQQLYFDDFNDLLSHFPDEIHIGA